MQRIRETERRRQISSPQKKKKKNVLNKVNRTVWKATCFSPCKF